MINDCNHNYFLFGSSEFKMFDFEFLYIKTLRLFLRHKKRFERDKITNLSELIIRVFVTPKYP